MVAAGEEAFELRELRAALVVGLAATTVILGLFTEAVGHQGKVVAVAAQIKDKTLLRVQLAAVEVEALGVLVELVIARPKLVPVELAFPLQLLALQ